MNKFSSEQDTIGSLKRNFSRLHRKKMNTGDLLIRDDVEKAKQITIGYAEDTAVIDDECMEKYVDVNYEVENTEDVDPRPRLCLRIPKQCCQ